MDEAAFSRFHFGVKQGDIVGFTGFLVQILQLLIKYSIFDLSL